MAEINVMAYGAVGDNHTDDAPAIQRAFDAAVAGDKIVFPSGIYRVSFSPAVTNTPNLTISGATLRLDPPED